MKRHCLQFSWNSDLSLFVDTAQQAERDKVVLELYRASFLHVAKCVKDELVLSDIQPKFPDLVDLEDEWEQSLSKDKKYIDFKKERDDLMIRWGQHIEQAKRAKFVFLLFFIR